MKGVTTNGVMKMFKNWLCWWLHSSLEYTRNHWLWQLTLMTVFHILKTIPFVFIVRPFPAYCSQTFPSQLFSPACSWMSCHLFLQPRQLNWGIISSVAYWTFAYLHLNTPQGVISFPPRSGFLFLYYLSSQVYLSQEARSHSRFLPYPAHGVSCR